MIFRFLGQLVSRHWKLVLLFWGLAFSALTWTAPAWEDVVRAGEFVYLPDSAPSQIGEAVYRDAFSHDLLGSTAVIVVRRAGRAKGLLPQDREFVEKILKPAILHIGEEESGLVKTHSAESSDPKPPTGKIIRDVRTAEDRVIGKLLLSNEKPPKTTLVLIEFTTRFLNRENWPILRKIETLIAQEGELVNRPENLFTQKQIPPGLELSLSGPAAVGRDLRQNSDISIHSILQWTLLIGIAGLLVFYRAPLLVLTVVLNTALSVGMTQATLAHLVDWGVIEIFAGLENYGLVVLAGVGVMTGMLFVSQELEARLRTPTLEDATMESLRLAGPMLASGAVIMLVGWHMLVYAHFGKFQQLGAALLIGVAFVGFSTFSFIPSLLAFFGRWALWPNLRTERISADQTWSPPRDPWSRLRDRDWSQGFWQTAFGAIQSRSRPLIVGSLLAMAPFALLAVLFYGNLSYGLLAQLPEETASVKGARIIQEQFPAGSTGPVTLLIQEPEIYFSSGEGREVIGKLSNALEEKKSAFGIADIRSVAYPLGLAQKDVGMESVVGRMRRHRKAVKYYIGDKGPQAPHSTKLEIVFDDDPFSHQSIEHFEKLRHQLPELLPPPIADAKWHLLGAPASIRDLKTVTDRDRLLIQVLVIAGSFLSLVGLFHRTRLALGLIGFGAVNYLTSLGITFAGVWLWTPGEFEGLDWKVPTFLFAIQMVLSITSYGILSARLQFEEREHGSSPSLLRMLKREGSVFLASGLITTGIFASLLGGSLVGLKQLGLGLSCAVLLDALLIRPWLIPAWITINDNSAAEAVSDPLPETGVPASPDSASQPESFRLTVPPDSNS